MPRTDKDAPASAGRRQLPLAYCASGAEREQPGAGSGGVSDAGCIR
jgi:hypothetical protein